MKHTIKTLFIIAAILVSHMSAAAPRRETVSLTVNQTISTSAHNWTLKWIEASPSRTVLLWEVTPKSTSTYIQMTKGVYLLDNNGRRYNMVSYNGISMEPKRDIIYGTDPVYFTVVFPALDANASSITYYSSPSFQIRNIALTDSYYGGQGTSRVSSFHAYANCFSHIQNNGNWSGFSEWEYCDITIEYNPSDALISIISSHIQKFRILSYEQPDPSIHSFECEDVRNGDKCEIEFVTLPDDQGQQIYVTTPYDRTCFAISKGNK